MGHAHERDVIEEQIVCGQLFDLVGRHADHGGVGGHLAGEVVEPRAAARFAGRKEVLFCHIVLLFECFGWLIYRSLLAAERVAGMVKQVPPAVK